MERIYGVTFGDKHSYHDWGVYWNGYSEDSPEPQRLLLEVPFKDGLLDATSALTSKRRYKSRKLTFDFIVHENSKTWPEVRAMIQNDIHGQALNIVLDTDPDFYWQAYNCLVGTPSAEEEFLKFNVECECYPYKLRNEETVKTVTVDGSNIQLTCPNLYMPVNPTFTTTQDVQVLFTNADGSRVVIAMSTGSHKFDNIEFAKGDNVLTFNKQTVNANVTVTYREGEL